MPAYLTHRAAGERVLDKLGSGVIPHNMAYFLGCQGPDILFFRNYHPWLSSKNSLSLAIAMHSDNVREEMANALEFAQKYDGPDKDELISYIAGFITHYAIDKNAHPFVYGKAGKDTNAHHGIEFMWDSYSAKEQWDIDPQSFDAPSEIMYDDVGEGICAWYKNVANDVYQKVISLDVVREAQWHFAKAKKALANINLAGKVLIHLVSATTGFDARRMLYPERRDETWFTQEEYKQMQEMIAKGVAESCDMIQFALDFVGGQPKEIPEWFGDKDFAGIVTA